MHATRTRFRRPLFQPLRAAQPTAMSLIGVCAWALCILTPPMLAQTPVSPAAANEDAARESPRADLRSDPATGAAINRWPKARPFDFDSIALTLDIPDAHTPVLTGVATFVAHATALPQSEMILDCDGPEASAVTCNGVNAAFVQETIKASGGAGGLDARVLRISMPASIQSAAPGVPIMVVVKYALDFTSAKGEGLTWIGPRAQGESADESGLAPMIHSQGQAELNSKWFPCFDAPGDRLTSEVVITVDADFQTISNGVLVSKEQAPPGSLNQPRTRWRWKQDSPHVPYLIAIGIGKWSVIDVSDRPGLPMPVYVPIGMEARGRALFANTPRMIAHFETLFGTKFPWAKYAQVCVRGFDAGGMENTSCTFLRESSVFKDEHVKAGDIDDLISHELAHQWFGDLVTCRSWDHLWLNEGFATYAELLWEEHQAQENPEPDAEKLVALTVARGSLRGQIRRNNGVAPFAPAMVSNHYTNPDSRFGIRDNPYSKGMFVLHMLRHALGDEVFFAGVRSYLDAASASGLAETADLRRAMEAVSGKSLERFFDQWTARPGIPRLRMNATWIDSQATLIVECEQTQTIDALNPAYAIDVPVLVRFADQSEKVFVITTDATKATASILLPATPSVVEFDPHTTLLASIAPRAMDAQSGAALPSWETVEDREFAAPSANAGSGAASASAAGEIAEPSPEDAVKAP